MYAYAGQAGRDDLHEEIANTATRAATNNNAFFILVRFYCYNAKSLFLKRKNTYFVKILAKYFQLFFKILANTMNISSLDSLQLMAYPIFYLLVARMG